VITRTGLQLITRSLKQIGVVAGHEVPTSSEQADAFASLNALIDAWGLAAQTLYAPQREVVTLVAGQQTYTVGPGGDLVVAVPPASLEAVTYVSAGSDPELEIGLTLGFDQAYLGIWQKTLSGAVPLSVTYTRGAPLASLWVWPAPTVALDVVLYWRAAVAQFPDLVTPVDLMPGYARALETNLAVELAPTFSRVVDPKLEQQARDSLADLKRMNLPLVEVGIDPGLAGRGRYNILTDR
jgi:hypothetical protein